MPLTCAPAAVYGKQCSETSSLRTLKIMPGNLNKSTLMNSASVLFSKVCVQYTTYI
jgi:hypothetical protein